MSRSLALSLLALGCGSEPAAVNRPVEAMPPVRLAIAPPAPPAPPPPPIERIVARAGSAVALARTGETTLAFVADEDAAALRTVDVDRLEELGRIALPGKPARVIVLDDLRLAVTLRDRDQLIVLAGAGLPGAPFAIEQTIALATEPIDLALAPDDRTLAVTSGWGRTLTAIAVPRGAPLVATGAWPLAPEPRAVVFDDAGTHAYVSHAIGKHVERVELVAGAAPQAITVDGTEEVSSRHDSVRMVPRAACQGFALAKSVAPAGRIYAPEVLAFTGEPTVASSGYGGGEGGPPEMFTVAVIDQDAGSALTESTVLRDLTRGRHCGLPRAAAASATGSLFVTCLGADVVLELDGAAIAPAHVELRAWEVPAGPTGIALDDAHARAVVWSQHAHSLSTLSGPTVKTLALDDHSALPERVARGRRLFTALTDFRISTDGRGCESCHPDGRQDGLVWSSPHGPRQTPQLAGRLSGTGPFGWNGESPDVAHHLASTFKRLNGAGLTGPDLDALLAYVEALEAPAPAGASDSLVAEGEQVFRSADAQCASCHGDDGRTPDGVRHNVDSWVPGDTRAEFDTPSLAGLANSAPYYHDGRFATLRRLLVGSRKHMGQQRALSPHELAALEAYLRTR